MKEISLTKRKVAIVDDSDYEWLIQWKWYATNPGGKGWRAQHDSGGRKSRVRLAMSRVIMGLNPGDRRVVDHINHNPLDNRRQNLRVATLTQNNQNARHHRDSISGFKGVSWCDASPLRPWRAVIAANGKRHHIGLFPTREAAHAAYCAVASVLHGEFSCAA